MLSANLLLVMMQKEKDNTWVLPQVTWPCLFTPYVRVSIRVVLLPNLSSTPGNLSLFVYPHGRALIRVILLPNLSSTPGNLSLFGYPQIREPIRQLLLPILFPNRYFSIGPIEYCIVYIFSK